MKRSTPSPLPALAAEPPTQRIPIDWVVDLTRRDGSYDSQEVELEIPVAQICNGLREYVLRQDALYGDLERIVELGHLADGIRGVRTIPKKGDGDGK